MFECFKYPAGEWQVRLRREDDAELIEEASDIRVLCHVKSADDIIKVCLLGSALDDLNVTCPRTLVLPYMPYARADRRFKKGDCFGIETFATVINQYYQTVATLDIHSPASESPFEHLINVSALPLIKHACVAFAKEMNIEEITVLYPDIGASNRYELPPYVGSNLGSVRIHKAHCTKQRDAVTGNLSGFEVPDLAYPAVIVDDICDGGGTFVGIYDSVARVGGLGLYITHGIFSRGIGDLHQKFRALYTTDTFYDGRFGKFVTSFSGVTEILKTLSEIERSRRSVTA
jgi:ribose-phosphate pyrophosphokinase